jgi:hypothetical protein
MTTLEPISMGWVGIRLLGVVATIAMGCSPVDDGSPASSASQVAPLTLAYANDAQGVRGSLEFQGETLTADAQTTSDGVITAGLHDPHGTTIATWRADPSHGIAVTVDGQTFAWGDPNSTDTTSSDAPLAGLAALQSTPSGQALHALGLAAMATHPTGVSEAVQHDILFLATPAGLSVADTAATASTSSESTGQATDGVGFCSWHWTACTERALSPSGPYERYCRIVCMPSGQTVSSWYKGRG